MSRSLPATLWGVVAALALALAVLWLGPGPVAAWRHWQAPGPQPPNLDDLLTMQLRANPAAGAAYPAVLERPLLNPRRQPQAPASAASSSEVAEQAPIDNVKLRGIVAGPTLQGVLLQDDGPQPRFVRRGEQVGDWVLDDVQGRHAVFVRSGEQRKIELTGVDQALAAGPAPEKARAPVTNPPRQSKDGLPVLNARRQFPAQPAPAPTAAPSSAAAPPAATGPLPGAAPARPRVGGFGGGRPVPAADPGAKQ